VSVGLALAATGETDEALVSRADEALYEVKRLGRDGVRLAPRA
jgi:GGDEF domain-containing protein